MTFLKKRFVTAISLATCVLALSACSSSVPSCSDKKITDRVIEIAKSEIVKEGGEEGASLVKVLAFKIVDVRTIEKDEKSGAYKCASNLVMTGPVGTNTLPTWYTVEATDDGNFYVSVAEEPI